MHKLISNIISNLKGEEFILDHNISLFYIINILLEKFLALLTGVIRFRKVCYISFSSSFKSKKLFKFGRNLNIGKNVYIDALSKNGVILGDNVSFQKYVSIECTGSIKNIGYGLEVGCNVGIGSNSFLGCAGGIKIGNDTIIGNYVSFHSESHNFRDPLKVIRLQGVNRQGISVGNNCWIGAKATILDGARIGENSIVAAGSVVLSGEYPDNVLIAGNPAKVKKNLYDT